MSYISYVNQIQNLCFASVLTRFLLEHCLGHQLKGEPEFPTNSFFLSWEARFWPFKKLSYVYSNCYCTSQCSRKSVLDDFITDLWKTIYIYIYIICPIWTCSAVTKLLKCCFFSNPESSNVIITASNKGLKFWDIRWVYSYYFYTFNLVFQLISAFSRWRFMFLVLDCS